MRRYHKIQTVFKRDPLNKHKTLIEGAWTLPEFEYLANNKWVFTEKVDGTNIRVHYLGGKITFGGRTDRAQLPMPLVDRLKDSVLLQLSKFEQIFGDKEVCLYGEGYGARIQKGGGNYRSDQDFVLFDVMVGDIWLQRQDVGSIAQRLGIDVVPILGEGTLLEMVEQARHGIQSDWGNFKAEGYVARPSVELKTSGGHRLITKIKCRDFLYHNSF